ncbi:MAG: hypothetical protein ACXV2C_00100 [Candidatus Bathyarchaeia archaeon]
MGDLYWDIFRPKTLKKLIVSQYNDGYQLQTITNRYESTNQNFFTYYHFRVQVMERFMWILADESYYDEDESEETQAFKSHLPLLEWYKLNR